ncbi:RfbC dTDP-4-dehydrorhamnose 3,5-epimerase and related enzymes [Candidatus Methylopumilus universalis]|uniref:dTDP-4-dehydrorhamnose 3,5-epimerase family protein n=1 Tax=Candidatus Methylopumilus universalis TaxID=2588536 RepID=UPI003BEF104F
MKYFHQSIAGVILVKPEIFEDNRGTFRRNFCAEEMVRLGINFTVCQGNISENYRKDTIRGFHYQTFPSHESKILTPIFGGIYNVVIDLRPTSKTFLQWVALDLQAKNRESLHVPAGCANAFMTTSDNTIIQYYMGDYFKPESYSGFRYDDPYFNIPWPAIPSEISEHDLSFPTFSVENL